MSDANGLRVIRAEIDKSDRCYAEGHSVRAFAPVLAMCRKLVDAGFNPATPLHAYRGDTLCLTVSSIGWGAKHTLRDGSNGAPRLARWQDRQETMRPALPMRLDAAE
jgi:hypothetical protein